MLNRLTLLLLAPLLAASPPAAQAQQVAPATPVAAPDTVAAIHRLFAAKRRVFRYVVGGYSSWGIYSSSHFASTFS